MNVTSKGRYALMVMIDLAQHPDDGFISLKTIADRQGISMKYLEMIVGSLKKAELVDSIRGKEGGYKLNRAPEEYTAGMILRCIEDNLAPVSCIRYGSITCDHASSCLTVPMWKELDDITNAYLDTVSLSDLLTGLERTSDHCSNIAGCVIDTAQHNLNLHESLRATRLESSDFIREFNRYARKYALPASAAVTD